jgi:chorismate mutase/prephenate dehydratase
VTGTVEDLIRQLRERIDEIDGHILRLVSERAQCAHDIGVAKGDGAVYRPEREAQVLQRLRDLNPGPLPGDAVVHLFTEIISTCRALERAMRVAYLGPRGTYSEEAVVKHFGSRVDALACGTIEDVFRTVEAGAAGYAVVPLENSTEGGVGATLDHLVTTELRICGEVLLPIHHCLLSNAGTVSDVRTVYAHSQALGQCAGWLARELPGAARVALASNAEAARRAAEEGQAAAIASRSAAELYGLGVLSENIEDDPKNTTRFLVLGQQDAAPSGRDRTSMVVSAPNRAGAIHGLLEPLARHGVSMTRLESRPSRQGLWEYVFFIDVEGHRQDAAVARALAELGERAVFLKVLGSYPAAVH